VELHPTPESWRVALLTALGALVVVVAGATTAALFSGTGALLAAGILVGLAGLATFAPAIGALSATVDADSHGVAVRRFGRTSQYTWADVVAVRIIERRASVPDGTEYHWMVPRRSAHVVAVPCLELADGRMRELPALAAPATGPRSIAAREYAALLSHLRTLTAGSGAEGENPLSQSA
jgi:hypothetical protein